MSLQKMTYDEATGTVMYAITAPRRMPSRLPSNEDAISQFAAQANRQCHVQPGTPR